MHRWMSINMASEQLYLPFATHECKQCVFICDSLTKRGGAQSHIDSGLQQWITHLELLPELRLALSGTWSLFSGASEAEADDDWDDTDSLLPIDVSSVARLELSATTDT